VRRVGLAGTMQLNNRVAAGDDRPPGHLIAGGRASPRAAHAQAYRGGLVHRSVSGFGVRSSRPMLLKTIGEIGNFRGCIELFRFKHMETVHCPPAGLGRLGRRFGPRPLRMSKVPRGRNRLCTGLICG
jgi:hypothetical protein